MQPVERTINPARIYTPEDVGEIFQVAPGTIRRLIRQGSINGFHVGVNPRMTGAQLLEFVAGGGARVADQPDDAEPDDPKITTDAAALAETLAA